MSTDDFPEKPRLDYVTYWSKLKQMKQTTALIALLLLGPTVWANCPDDDPTDHKTFKACIKTAEKGNPDAQLIVGNTYTDGKLVPQNYQEALKWYRKAAQQDSANAMYNIGVFYDKGYSVDKSYEEASVWYAKAADLGFPGAQYNIGIMYEYGQTVPKDYKKAREYYVMAAEKGEPSAQFALGLLYDKGLGVEKDLVQAYMWWDITGDGHIHANHNKTSLSEEMTPMQITEAQRLARAWLKKHKDVPQLPAQVFPQGYK